MRVTVKTDELRPPEEKRTDQSSPSQLADDVSTLLAVIILSTASCLAKEVVQLGNQAFHSRNELDQALRDQYRTGIVTLSGTLSHDTSHVSNDIVQRHILLLNLLGDDTNIRLVCKAHSKSDMRSGALHQFDEVPVFLGGVTVTLDVTDYLGGKPYNRVETEEVSIWAF